jgi:hypothetical protein
MLSQDGIAKELLLALFGDGNSAADLTPTPFLAIWQRLKR